ncbi:MAG TPA: hypothetical protein VJ997_12720, partial [Longimicrobiales bacterium]|nr:hypothetical protein [Longimicrobiales bacterium]
AAFQWSGPGELCVSFTILPGHEDVRYHVGEHTVRAESSASVGREGGVVGVEALVHPAPERWQVEEGNQGGIQVHARVPVRGGDAGPVTLLVAAGAPEVTGRALGAGRHLGAHALRAATDQDPANAETLLPRTGVAELDQGVGWAAVRLAGVLRRGDLTDAGDWFWAGVGALASGDGPGAVRAARRIRERRDVSLWPGSHAPGPALSAFLAARATLLSGDEAPAQEALERLGPATLEEARSACEPGRWAWWALALGTLADALRYAASEEETRGLRAMAARPAGLPPRTLPMVGVGAGGPKLGTAPWIAALLRGERPGGGGAPPAFLAPWAALAEGDADGGYAAWRAVLGEGLAGSAGSRGSWAPPARGAASVLATFAFGLLGLEPDAPSGRIRIAPALPAHVRDFRVQGIRVGDARLELSYRREERVHRFRLDATDGRVPPMVVLEPSLPLRALGAVRVDGAPADLTSQRHGPGRARTRLSVQIPVDGPRLLEIEEG